MHQKRIAFPRRRRGHARRTYRPAIQLLEDRLMLTGGPPVANNDAYTTYHDRALIITTSSGGVLANDTDPNGYTLTANLVTGVSHGTLTLNNDGTFTYMPSAGYSGSDSFTYQDSDGTYDSNVATVTITVQETAPVANDESFTIGQDRTLSGAISATDAEGDALTASVVLTTQHGTLTPNPDGSFTYTPDATYVGDDSFTYQVSDGLESSNTATVDIAVTQTTPLAGNVYYTTGAGQALDSTSLPGYGVLAYTTDAEGGPLTAQVVTQPQDGTLSFGTDGSFVYTPDSGFTGLDTFTFDASDGIETSNVATAYIYVGTQSDIQNDGSDNWSSSEGTPLTGVKLLNWSWDLGTSTDYSAMVQWGDGTESSGTIYYQNSHVGYWIEGTHTYATAGTYSIAVVVLGDSTAQHAMAIFSDVSKATISDQPLTATSLSFDAYTNQATPVEAATFTDADPNAKASDYTATIDWGNGLTTAGAIVPDPNVAGQFDVYGTDPYTATGSYTVGVTIQDDGGSTASANSTANVSAIPLAASNLTASATAGTAFSGTVATFTDTYNGNANTIDSIVGASIDWGDGTTSIGTIVADPNVPGQYDVLGTHTYAGQGSDTITVTLTDKSGAWVAVSDAMTVADAALSASQDDLTVVEGQSYDGPVAHFTDGNPNLTAGDFWATIDWGNGDFGPGTVVADPDGGFDVTGSNTYTGRGPYTTTVTIHDQSGSSVTVNGAVTVTVPPPMVTIAATQPDADAATGVSGTFTVTRTGDTTLSLTVNYIVSGTAAAGTDYTALSGSVTIPAGSSSAAIPVNPLVDWNPLVVDPSTVVVTLSPSTASPPAYTVSSQSITATDTVTSTITGTQTGIVVSPTVKNSANSLAISGLPETLTAGTTYSITVTALTAAGAVFTNYAGTVSFSTNDGNASLPSSYTFTTADAGVHTFSVTFKAAGAGYYLKVNDSATAGITNFSVTPAAASYLSVINFPTPVSAGVAQSFAVVAYDPYNNIATGYTGTVKFTSTDSAATLPANYTFTSTDAGVHIFTATLATAGLQSITATDTVTSTITGTESGIGVNSTTTGTGTMVQEDWTTQGNWIGAYGSQGYDVINDASSLPSYATITASGESSYIWASSTTDPRALEDASPGTSRIAACWYSSSSFTVTVDLTDGNTHDLALYFLDWDGQGRSERVQLTNVSTGALLETETISSFSSGAYLDFQVSGDIKITITNLGAVNAVLSGLFLDPNSIAVPAQDSLQVSGLPATVTAGTPYTVTVTALTTAGATDTDYRGTVHFSSNDGSAVLPLNYTFTAADGGSHQFTVTFKTAGSTRWVKAADISTDGASAIATVDVTPGAVSRLAISGIPGTVPSGYPETFTVTAYDAYGNVETGYTGTVHFSSGDSQATLPPSYTFTSADDGEHTFSFAPHTAGSFNLTATDAQASGVSGSANFTVTAPQAPTAVALRVSGVPAQVTAGVTYKVTVAAVDPNGNTVTSYRGTVALVSTDPLAALPASYTFTSSDNGVHTFSVMFLTAGTQSITATDVADNLTGTESNIVVVAAPAQPAATLVVSGAPTTTTAGAAFTITVTAESASGATVTGYTGTVHFTSNNTQAVLPADYTFTSADQGVHTFTVALKTAALGQYIKATDTAAVGVAGVSGTVWVTPAAASRLAVASFPTDEAAGAAQEFTVEAFDPYNNVATGYTGTIHFTSTDAAASLPANYTFTSADAGLHTFAATLSTVGTQSITATDTQTPGLSSTEGSIAVSTPQSGATTALELTGVPATVTAGESFTITVTALLDNGSTATGYDDTISFSSGDGQAVLPANYTFVPSTDEGVHTFTVTFKTAGPGDWLKVVDNGAGGIKYKDQNPASPGLAGIATLDVTPAAASKLQVANFPSPVASGSPHSFTVTALDPYGNVATSYTGTIKFTSTDSAAVLPGNFTFVAGNDGAATLTGTTLETVGSQSLTATDTVTSTITGTQSSIQVDGAQLQIGSLPAQVTSCSPTSITITVLNGAGNVATGYRGTVQFSSSDPLAVLPAPYTFTSADAGVHTFSVQFETSGTQSLAVTDLASGLTIADLSILVATTQGYVLTVTGYPTTVAAGTQETFTVSERNAQGQLVTTTTDTVHFSSSDPQAVLPANYTFTSADGGQHTFTATFQTAGVQSITATDISCCLSAYEGDIQVQPGPAVSLSVADYPSPVFADTTQTFIVTARDAYGNVATGYRGTVTFSSSDPLAELPANYTFTAADNGTHLFTAEFETPDAQSSDTVDIQQDNPSNDFLQGTVYDDADGSGQYDLSNAPIPGATVQLYAADGTTLLGTTTTDANGQYLFTSANVAGGDLLPGTYELVETPPAGYVSEGVQSTSGIDPSTALSSDRIQVTLPTMTGLTLNLGSPGTGEYGTVDVNGSPLAAYIGLLNLTLIQSGTTLATLSGDCVALLESVNWGNTFNITAQPSLTGLSQHAGQIAWLLDMFGGPDNDLTSDQAAGLQLAVWDLELDATPGFSSSPFSASTPGVTAAALADANTYLSESAGESAMAIFLDAQYTSPGNSGGFQGMVTTDSFNFGNVAGSQPASSLSGYVYVDANNNGKVDPGEPGIAGVTVILSGTNDQGQSVTATAVTAADGSYLFQSLYPGTYTLTELDPSGYVDAKDTAGTAGGTVGHDTITGIVLGEGVFASGYDFGWERAPVFTSTPISQVAPGAAYVYDATATDADGDTLTYSLLEGPSGMTIGASSGEVTWSPGSDAAGTYSVILQVSDGRGGLDQQDYTVTVATSAADRPPFFTSEPVLEATVGSSYLYPATAFDPDGDPLTFSVVSGPAGLTIDPTTGLVTWTPASEQLGDDPVTLEVSDGRGGTATQSYDILVVPDPADHPPVIISTPVTSLAADFSDPALDTPNDAYFVVPGETGQDVDLTFTNTSENTYYLHNEAGLYDVVDAQGDVPDPDALDQYDFGTADSPVAAGYTQVDPATTYSDAQGYGWTSGTVTAVDRGIGDDLDRDFDATADATFAVDLPDGRYLVTITLGDTGSVAHDDMGVFLQGNQADDVSTLAGQEVVRSYQVDVEDGQLTLGLQDLGGSDPDVAIDGLQVQGLLAPGDPGYSAAALAPGNTQILFPSGFQEGMVTDVDLTAGDLIAFYLIQNSSTTTFLADNPDDQLDGSPLAFFSFAQANPDPDEDDPSIPFNHVHTEIEVAQGLTEIDWEDQTGGGDQDFNDCDFTINALLIGAGALPDYSYPVVAISPDGDALTYSMPVGPAGAVIDPQTGLLTWTPTAPGDYDFTVRVDDGHGGFDTQSFVLDVASDQVGDINGTVFDDANGDGEFETDETPLEGVTVYLDLNHDGHDDAGDPSTTTDVNGDYSFTGLAPGTYTVAEVPPTGWTITAPAGGTRSVTIAAGSYIINQDFGDQDPSAVDHAPVFQTTPPTTGTVGVAWQYNASATDPDDDPLTYSLLQRPLGMAVDPTTGTVVWTPTAGEVGLQEAVLQVSDGRGDTTVQPILVTVAPADIPPVITSVPPVPAYDGVTYTYQVTAVSPMGYDFTFSLGSGDNPDGLSLTSGGLLTWTDPALGDDPTLTIDVTDSQGGAGTPQTFALPVEPVPGSDTITLEAPPASSTPLSLAFSYLPVATDTLNAPLTYTLVSGPDGMSMDPDTHEITWTPTADEVPSQTMVLQVSDGYVEDTWTFTIGVATAIPAQPPRITSTPVQYAVVGDLYRDNLAAEDADGDTLDPQYWTLVSGPAGMVLDPTTDALIWTPTTGQANTLQSVTVTVNDGQGDTASQSFTIDVLASDSPPLFQDFTPPTTAGVGVPYAYQVQAGDQQGLPMTYTLTADPTNTDITISSTGLIQWSDPGPVGTVETLTVTATDPAGLSATETYTLTVQSTAPGTPPVFDSPAPPAYASVGYAYTYTASANATAGDEVTYAISSDPDLTDLSINATTGVVSWTPTSDDADLTQPVAITITATDDTLGVAAFLTFDVTVTNVAPPSLTPSNPQSTITAGLTYTQQFQGSDPSGQPVTYELLGTVPTGMAVDADGRVTWTTTTADIGSYPIEIEAVATDGLTSTPVDYTLNVVQDTQPPTVQIEMSSDPANLSASSPYPADMDSVVYFHVVASDPVGVTSLSLTVGGVPVLLNADGEGQFTTPDSPQALTVTATADDAAGLSNQATATLDVVNPTDTSAPIAQILAPSGQANITQPTEVTGYINDSDLLSWTLDEAPLNSSTYTTIATGTVNVASGGDLGLFDPTTLADGAYTLRLTAINADFQETITSITVNVSGYLKLGNLDLSFTDLTIPVAGIPITITRTYDSLDANTQGDFGYGWTLSETDYQLSVSNTGSGPGSLSNYTPLYAGSRVLVTLPDGTTEGFTFEPQPVYNGGDYQLFVQYYTPYFVPDPGVTDTLSAQSAQLQEISNSGEFYVGEDDYNPAQPEFGGFYTLTDESGLATNFDATTGQVISESDLHGNTLTFASDGIYSNTGLAVTITRDPAHGDRITEITDPDGDSIVYGYDAAGDLVSVTDRDGNVTQFTYSTAQPHFLTQITDAMGDVVMAGQYNTSGRLTSITNATGASDTLSYNLSNLSESALAPGNSSPTTNFYNSEGLLIESVDPDGIETTYEYDSNNYLIEKDQVGAGPDGQDLITTYENNAYGQVTQETDPSGNVIEYTYDPYGDPQEEDDDGSVTLFGYYYDSDDPNDPMNGDLLWTIDPLGSETSFTYDDAGDVLTTTTAAGTTTNTYDPYGNLLTTTTPQGVTTTNTYDADGNLLTSSWVWTNPSDPDDTEDMETVNTYDGNGNLVETQTDDNGVLQTTTTTTYNADGEAISSTDEYGGVTSTVYDANGNVIQTTTPDGMVTDTVYNTQGQVTYTDDPHQPGTPTDGTLTEYDQDGNVIGTEQLSNLVITVTVGSNGIGTSAFVSDGGVLSTSTTEYNSAGEVSETFDPSGLVTTNQYDVSGNLTETQETVNGVTRTTTSAYNAQGEMTSTTDALGNTTTYAYNPAGQVTTTTFADNSSITDQYNDQGEETSEIDQDGNETQYKYDQYGDLTEVIEPAVTNPATGETTNPTTYYTYDAYGDMTSMTDANGDTTLYTYDQYGNMVSETLPMGQTETWTYNALGQMTSSTDFDGNVTDYVYYTAADAPAGVAPGTLETETIKASDGTTYDTITYTYGQGDPDSNGNYTNIVADTLGSTTDDTYDLNGNLVQVSTLENGVWYTTNYTYNLATGLETSVWTTNTATTYGYDQAGELTSVTVTELDGQTLSTPLVTGYSYNADGELVFTQNANGTTETRSYNAVGELTSIVDTNGSGTYASFTYTYDPAGLIQTETDQDGTVDTYTYDADGRLTQEVITAPQTSPRTLTWTYDLVGNQVASTDTGAAAGQQSLTYTYDANDQLLSITGTDGYAQNYSYDADGNTTAVTGSGGAASATYTWDAMGRMIAATTGGSTVSYTYDDAGNRTSETVNGLTTTYLNDPNQAYDQVLEEYAPGGVLAATYIQGLDLLFQDRSGVLSFYATDILGSTRALTDAAGSVTDTYTYDAYGNLIASTGTTPNEFLFTGQQYDAATGQYYQRARYYDASVGRFTSRDTYDGQTDDPITENHYVYANADPVDGTDPSGLQDSLIAELAVATIQAGSFALNAAGAVLNTYSAVTYGIDAYTDLFDGQFVRGMAELLTAVYSGGIAALNFLGIKSFLKGGPPTVSGGLALAYAGGSAASYWRTVASASPAVFQWVQAQVVPAIFTVYNFMAIQGQEWATDTPPARTGKATEGVLDTGDKFIYFKSQKEGPAQGFGGKGSGFSGYTKTHAEGHAAAYMRLNKITFAVLRINNTQICDQCLQNLTFMLPRGAVLWVVDALGRFTPFTGL